jgi:hypothetical protein
MKRTWFIGLLLLSAVASLTFSQTQRVSQSGPKRVSTGVTPCCEIIGVHVGRERQRQSSGR